MRVPSYQELSQEQDAILDLPLKGKHLVIGPPGTGKTVLALHRGRMLNRSKVYFRLLMYNHALRKYTSGAVEAINLEASVEVYHRFFYKFICKNFRDRLMAEGFTRPGGGVRVPEVKEYLPDFRVILEKVIPDPAGCGIRFPHLIVDEGQDLPGGFYHLFRHLAEDTTVFADENQIITDTGSTISDIQRFGGFQRVHKVTRNYRNSLEIARFAAGFFTGTKSGIPELPERRGEKPRLIRTRNLADQLRRIQITEGNTPEKTIGVLAQTNACLDSIAQGLERLGTRNPVQLYNQPDVDFDSPGIKLVTWASAKGLEFDTVFLPELQAVYFNPNSPELTRRMLFVLTSRARERLVLFQSGERLPLLTVFPVNWEDLVEQEDISSSSNPPNSSEVIRPQPSSTAAQVSTPVKPSNPSPAHYSLQAAGTVDTSETCRASELLQAWKTAHPSGTPFREAGSALVRAAFHPEVHELVTGIVETAASHQGKIIGVCTSQAGLFKRLQNRLPGKTSPLFFHELSGSQVHWEGLEPGLHVFLALEAEGVPFDILFIPRAESLAIDSPHCLRRLYDLVSAAREQVIFSYENRPTPLLPKIPANILKRIQESR